MNPSGAETGTWGTRWLNHRHPVGSPPPWKVAFPRCGKSKSASDESVAKKRSKEGEKDEEREWGCQG